MAKHPKISVVINVHNEAADLEKCLKSCVGFSDEIIVVDMHSTDKSADVAKKFGAKLFSHKFLNYVEPARNYALSKAKAEWILLLDPDEYLPKELKKELLKISHRQDVDFVKIPRKNLILGRWLRHSRMWPDYLIRFFRKGKVVWKNEIHSQPETSGNGLTLLDSEKLAIRHLNYTSVNSFITRALRYSSIQAEELNSQNYRPRTADFLLRPIQEFNSRFFADGGYKDGIHGLIFCLLQTFAILLIYIKLWELQGAEERPLSKDSFVSASLETEFEYSYWFNRYVLDEYTKNPIKLFMFKLKYYFQYLAKIIR